jgi:hypothetical protein
MVEWVPEWVDKSHDQLDEGTRVKEGHALQEEGAYGWEGGKHGRRGMHCKGNADDWGRGMFAMLVS